MAGHHSMCCASSVYGADGAGAGMNVDGGGDPMPGHGAGDLAHLCLAVLGALVFGALGVGFCRRRTERSSGMADAGRLTAVVARPPPPRPAGRAVLTSLCLLRV